MFRLLFKSLSGFEFFLSLYFREPPHGVAALCQGKERNNAGLRFVWIGYPIKRW